MGFFSNLKQKIGEAISKVGEVLNSSIIARLGANLENRRSKVVETIGVSKAMNPKKDSISETQKINDTLATYARYVKNDSVELEHAISASLDHMHSILEKMTSNDTIRGRLNLDYSSARSNAKDIFTAHISRRISSADSECVEIMKMRPSKKKAERMDAFTKQVTREASRLAAESIKSVLRNQNQQLKEEYDAKLQNELSILRQSQQDIERIKNERLKLEDTQSSIAPRYTQILHDANLMMQILSDNQDKYTFTICNGIYQICSSTNSKYGLSIDCNSMSDAARIHLWEIDATNPFSLFKIEYLENGYYQITNIGSQKVMDVNQGSHLPGTIVQQYTSNQSYAQQWQIIPSGDNDYSLISRCNNLYLDLRMNTVKNGSIIQTYAANNSSAQRWRLVLKEPFSNDISDSFSHHDGDILIYSSTIE